MLRQSTTHAADAASRNHQQSAIRPSTEVQQDRQACSDFTSQHQPTNQLITSKIDAMLLKTPCTVCLGLQAASQYSN
jgi:hypothetical protein